MILISPEPVLHLNMCVLRQNPTYIHYVLKYKCRHTYIHTYIHTYTHMNACLHTCIHACMYAYIHTYIYTYIHKSVDNGRDLHVCIYVYECMCACSLCCKNFDLNVIDNQLPLTINLGSRVRFHYSAFLEVSRSTRHVIISSVFVVILMFVMTQRSFYFCIYIYRLVEAKLPIYRLRITVMQTTKTITNTLVHTHTGITISSVSLFYKLSISRKTL